MKLSRDGVAPARRSQVPSFRRLAILMLLIGCGTPAERSDSRAPAPVPSSSGQSTAAPAIDTVAIRRHTRVLAHDSMGGRGTGSTGLANAARYVAAELERLGARSVGLLPVPLRSADVSGTTLTLTTAVGVTTFAHGDGFLFGRVGRHGLRQAEGRVESLTDDSANVAHGTWLLIDAALGEAAVRWLPIWKRAGISGIVVRLPDRATFEGYRAVLGDVRWQLLQGPADPVWQPDLPVLLAGPDLAAALVAGDVDVRLDPNAAFDTVIDYNVVGTIPGADGARTDEFVVLTAHLDHLGTVAGDARGDSIYNGFSDNAAGVAMLLAIAQAAASAPAERALLFLFPVAEEVGLLGSLHFTRNPPFELERIHAVVNLDAGAPPAPPTRWRLAAGTRSWAGAVAARVVEQHGATHRSDPGSPNSDHWPFVQLGIPAVFLIPDGEYEGVDAEGARRLQHRWNRYHRPDDEWSAEFPFAGLGRYARVAMDIAFALAAAEGSIQ